jgi:ubiquinone/menaquinone biosynthesis C-methylase UbiE
MVEEAIRRKPPGQHSMFVRADARKLPFKTASFARCRVDRTLQHIEGPQEAIDEMVRVLEPAGLLLAYDNDWGTFGVSGGNEVATKIIQTLWEESFTNKWIGRHLMHCFLEAGLTYVQVLPSVSLLTNFELADRVYNLRQTVKRAVASGYLLAPDADQWVSEMHSLSHSGRFFCSLTAFTAVGVKSAG